MCPRHEAASDEPCERAGPWEPPNPSHPPRGTGPTQTTHSFARRRAVKPCERAASPRRASLWIAQHPEPSGPAPRTAAGGAGRRSNREPSTSAGRASTPARPWRSASIPSAPRPGSRCPGTSSRRASRRASSPGAALAGPGTATAAGRSCEPRDVGNSPRRSRASRDQTRPPNSKPRPWRHLQPKTPRKSRDNFHK